MLGGIHGTPEGLLGGMKVLTLRQPNASLASTGVANLLNQDEKTDSTGPLLIHASKFEPSADEVEQEIYLDKAPWRDYSGIATTPGAVVGCVIIDGCSTTSNSPWFQGPFAWTISHHIALPVTTMDDQQGLAECSVENLSAAAQAVLWSWLRKMGFEEAV